MALLHTPVLLALPGMVQAQLYFLPQVMSPEFAERVAHLVEDATGLELSHTIRGMFPAVRKHSIAEEAALAWSAPRRRFRVSNALSHPEHMEFLAGVMPRRTESGRAEYAYVTLSIKAGSKASAAVAAHFEAIVDACKPVFARADAPSWGVGPVNPAAFGTVVVPVAPDWVLSERLGWVTYLPPAAFSSVSGDVTEALASLGVDVRGLASGGGMLRLSREPMRDSQPADITLYQEARKIVAQGLARSAF